MVPVRKMPLKTVKLEFSEDGYPDFHATGRLNVPVRIGDEFRSGDEERARKAALVIFPEWDFVDEEGNEIPHTVEGIGMIPQDLFAAMMTGWADALAGKTAIPPKADASSSPTSPSEPEANAEAPSRRNMPESS
jgi:hypothetical protein